MKLQEITEIIEKIAPISLKESYDNVGLLVGNPQQEIHAALVCIDVTESTVDEAMARNCNLIISHHPIIFSGLKRITEKTGIERCVAKCIKNDIAIYAAHTNLDNAYNGVNYRIAQKLKLQNVKILVPKTNLLSKLVTFVPKKYAETVRNALFEAGAGNIGNYDTCSFSHEGNGTFRAAEGCQPFCGTIGELHTENEIRLEVIVPKHLISNVLNALYNVHPYEEPAFDILPLANEWQQAGTGVVGNLQEPMDEIDFLKLLKSTFNVPCVKHSKLLNKKIKKVALCGGSGSDFIGDAKRSGSDVYITADVSYHRFAEGENCLLIADIGHFESEQYTKEIIKEQLIKNFPNFAVYLSATDGQTVFYL